jgi:hypothetical protein
VNLVFRRNRLMTAGILVGLLGCAAWAAGFLGAFPDGSALDHASLGTVLLGAVLYFLGRVVQIVQAVRSR